MAKGLFITGTDTGVGKTYVASGICAELRRRGADVGVMKPAETGCNLRDGRLIPRDALHLMKASGAHDPLDLVNPYRFRRPLAPSVAARSEKKTVRLSTIMSCFRKLSSRHEYMVVEGAGGILVPLSGKYTYLDLALALELPALVVARPSLGTINHTLLTQAVLKERGVSVAGIVINYAQRQKRGSAEQSNPSVIEELSGVRITGIISHGSTRFGAIVDDLAEWLSPRKS